MARCLAPTLAAALLLTLIAPAYAGTSYHRFASGLGMNIRHLPCVSRRTGEAGTCMFAYSCAKLNGTHLGTCIDRFYFGSCCRLPPGVELDALSNVSLDEDSNFIDDNNIATSEKPRPTQTIKPEYPSSTSSPSTIRLPPSISGSVSTKRPTPSTQRPSPSTQRPSSSTQRPSPSTQRPPPSSVIYPNTLRPSTSQTTSGTIPTKKYPFTTSRPSLSPTTPAPTLVTWTTIDGFPPRRPPSIVAPSSTTTHRTPATKPPVKVDHNKPTSIFNTTNGAITVTSPKPSSPFPSSSRPSVTIISTSKPTQKPSTSSRPSGTSSKPVTVVNTNRPATISPSRPTSQKPPPSPSISKPSSKPTVKPTKPPTKPPVKVTVKPSSPKPVTSVTIISSSKPNRPSKPETVITKPSRPSTQRPSTSSSIKPSTVVKPSTVKPVVKPTAKPTSKPTSKPTRPKPTKPVKVSTTKPSTKPTKPSTLRPPTIITTTTEATTDPDWVQVSVSSHEPSLPTTIFLTSENPWLTGRPGVTEASTLPVTFTTDSPSYTSPGPSSDSSTFSVISSTSTVQPPIESNEILNINMTDFRDVCGRRLFPEPRIVGGNKSTFGKWPWQISLRQWRTSTYLHKCGAALLSENWAITAAHCVENVPPSDLLLRLGEYDLSIEDEPYTFQERRVQIVASHPQFDPRTFEYDLALLRFYDPVQFQPNIIPICVPGDDTNFVGRTAFVTGWGRLYEDGPLPSILQEVSVPVINNTVCETMYRAAGYIEHIPDIFICAGWKKGGFDSCEGDSGGPMVIERDDDKRWVLAGVISWGIGCAEPNQPGVYTRISHFRHWINQILQF